MELPVDHSMHATDRVSDIRVFVMVQSYGAAEPAASTGLTNIFVAECTPVLRPVVTYRSPQLKVTPAVGSTHVVVWEKKFGIVRPRTSTRKPTGPAMFRNLTPPP